MGTAMQSNLGALSRREVQLNRVGGFINRNLSPDTFVAEPSTDAKRLGTPHGIGRVWWNPGTCNFFFKKTALVFHVPEKKNKYRSTRFSHIVVIPSS